jgi:TPR repeat protein
MSRYRTVKRSRRNKKRNGGMHSSLKPSSKSKPNVSAMVLHELPGVDSKLRSKALTVPGSGMFELLSDRLLVQPTSDIPVPYHVRESMHSAMSGVAMKGFANSFANEICKRAEGLHATSFRSQSVAECAQLNMSAVEQLKRAIAMGSLRARACLADMLLNGNTVGVAANFNEAIDLVSQFDEADTDCEGVLAHCYFKIHQLNDARRLAKHSAAGESKYGQFVLGLLEKHPKQAFKQFALAAAQNYDEAQIALSALCIRGYADIPPDRTEALRLLERAALQGNKLAFHSIATMYSHDADDAAKSSAHFLRHWFGLAKRWFTFSMEAGVRTAQDELGLMTHAHKHKMDNS